MSGIQTLGTRQISQELLDALENAFPVPVITKSSTEADIKWQAAQHDVVEWIKSKVGQKQTIGTPSQEAGRVMPTGAVVRAAQ